MDLRLIEPSKNCKKQFEEMVNDFKKNGEKEYYDMYKNSLNDFDKYVDDLTDCSKGINLPEGWSRQCTFWLTDSENKVLGNLRIRPDLDNDFVKKIGGNIGYDISPSFRKKGYGNIILRLALEKVKSMGLSKVLITCLTDNYASSRVIEKNGGVFESEYFYKNENETYKRYWIEL